MNYFYNFDKMKYVKGDRPAGCILCLLVEQSPNVVDLTVYSDQLFTVCVNLYPYNPGHLMIFPNRHIEDIRDYSPEEDERVARLTRKFLDIVDSTHQPAAFNIGYNMGPSAGASIDHLHMHLIPRYPREIGIADLVGGTRVLIEDPRVTRDRVIAAIDSHKPDQ